MERAMNLIFPHLEFDKLADLAEGRLSARDQKAALAHLSRCRHCSEKLAGLERAIEMMRADAMEDAPAYAFERARKLILARVKPPASAFKQVLATLTFDSLQMAPDFGLRAGAAAERQLLFTAGENDLHLQIKQAEERWVVCGQVLGPCSGGEVEIEGASATAHASLSDLCEFTLDSIPAGTYVLTLRLSDAELKVPDLKLGL
jgi:anti-sigma factor RsiW